jgi:TrmH family RNA methyltransferase
MIQITSPQNALFKIWMSLHSSKGIKKEKQFLVSGQKLVDELLKNKNIKVEGEIIHGGLESRAPHGTKVYCLDKTLFNEIDLVGTHYNIFVCQLPEISPLKPDHQPNGLELITPLGDPNNLGALVRSAEAFGVRTMILTEDACNPFHPKSVKASSGSVLRMNFLKAPSLKNLPVLKNIWALDGHGKPLPQFKWPKDLFLLVGEEGPGLAQADLEFKIPTLSIPTESVESLNAVVATSIALYSYKLQSH